MIVKIFVQPGCPNCPPAKELGKELEKEGLEVELHDVKTVDGLTEATYYDVMLTPSIVLTDGNKKIKTWCGDTPSVKEVKDFCETG
jgi:glutaredoxin